MFGCPECALDTRVATLFIDGAKNQLSELAPSQPEVKGTGKSKNGPSHWSMWFRPAFAIPVLAALVLMIGYQNLVTFPNRLRPGPGKQFRM